MKVALFKYIQVFIGRPVIWGLCCAGEGVKLVLEILRQELDLNMALTGLSFSFVEVYLMDFVCLHDLKQEAHRRLDKANYEFIASGSDQQETLKENQEAFKRWHIIPRMMKNVSIRCLETTVLGQKVSMPIGVAPIGLQKFAHPNGEIATVRGVASMQTIYIHSTMASTSIEDISSTAPNSLRWFQIYIYRDRNVTRSLIHRAEAAGFSAIVVTVDVPRLGRRLCDNRNNFKVAPHIRLANFVKENPNLDSVQNTQDKSSLTAYVNSLFDASIQWQDIAWLKSITSLPIIIKGILCADDALLSVRNGAAAVIVSNHGGRQLNGAPPTIEALPEIIKAVDGQCEVYMDGGIRQGTDVLKALALGARMVFIGRPVIWGLCCSGEEGVKLVLEILRQELDLNMALTGCCSISDVKRSLVRRRDASSRL